MKYFITFISLLFFAIACKKDSNQKYLRIESSNIDTCSKEDIISDFKYLGIESKELKITDCHKKFVFDNIKILKKANKLYSGKINKFYKNIYGYLVEARISASDYNSVILITMSYSLDVIDFVEVLGGHFAGPQRSKKTGFYFMGKKDSISVIDSTSFRVDVKNIYNINLDDKTPVFMDTFIYKVFISKTGEIDKKQVDSVRVRMR